MSFIKLLGVLYLSVCGSAKPLKGAFASRQVEPPTGSSGAVSTACGDIIVAVNNGEYHITRLEGMP